MERLDPSGVRDNGDVEVSLHQPWVCYKRGCSLQEGVDQSGQAGNIFTSQFSLDAVGERRGSSFLGEQWGVQHILPVPNILGPSIISSSFSQWGFVSPRPDRPEILVLPSLFPPSRWGQHFIFQCTHCAPPALGWGLALGTEGIPPVPGLTGIRGFLEGPSLGSHPHP